MDIGQPARLFCIGASRPLPSTRDVCTGTVPGTVPVIHCDCLKVSRYGGAVVLRYQLYDTVPVAAGREVNC
jgi:hypothetical protein